MVVGGLTQLELLKTCYSVLLFPQNLLGILFDKAILEQFYNVIHQRKKPSRQLDLLYRRFSREHQLIPNNLVDHSGKKVLPAKPVFLKQISRELSTASDS